MAAFNGAVGDAAGEPEGDRPIDLGRIGRALQANARAIALVVVAVTVVAYALALTESSRYRATARIAVDASAPTGSTSSTDARRLATSVAVLTSGPVLEAAAGRLAGESPSSLRDKVTTATASDADVIDITATDGDADRAAAIANEVATAFLIQRAANQRAAIARTRGALDASIAELVSSPERAADVAALRARQDDLVVADANAGSDMRLAEPAQAPASAYAPRPLRTAVLAFFGALAIAVLIVALRERLAPAVRPRDVERLAGVPLLATLPALPRMSVWDRWLERLAGRAPPRLPEPLAAVPQLPEPVAAVVARRRRAHAARRERVRRATDDGLRTVLAATLRALPPGDGHVILVTSAGRSGRSAYLAAALARRLAAAGQETLVLSSDLGSPLLADALGVAPAPALSQALDQGLAATAVHMRAVPVPGLDTLHVVPGGGLSRDSVGLVRPGAVDALFAAFAGTHYGYVVIEAPALLAAPEGCLVAREADAAILACPEKPSPEQLGELRRAIESLDVPVLGAVSLPAGVLDAPEPARSAAPAATRLGRPAGEELDESAAANGGTVSAADARLLLERLRAADRPLTFGELHEALGDASLGRLRLRLRQLVEAGEVERRGSGRRGDPYLYGPREP